MARQLHYFALVFSGGHARARYPFLCALDAEEGGEILARTADGVLVFQQHADLELGVFDEPETLLVIGDVPAAALMIDPDGPDPWLVDVA